MPLGLVGSYVGGTPIEAWTPPRGALFNSMIAPLTRMAVKFVLWYQVRAHFLALWLESSLLSDSELHAVAFRVRTTRSSLPGGKSTHSSFR